MRRIAENHRRKVILLFKRLIQHLSFQKHQAEPDGEIAFSQPAFANSKFLQVSSTHAMKRCKMKDIIAVGFANVDQAA